MTREEAIQKREIIVTQFINELGVTIETNTKPLIHCKNCKWSDWYETLNGEHRCYCMEHESSGHTDDDYCSYGEREESEVEE